MIFIKIIVLVLSGLAQWIECWPEKQRVASSIPSQGTCQGCRQGPHLGGVGEGRDQ